MSGMSHLDELDEYEAELELRLKKEYTAVFGLFRYCVVTQDSTYLCNKLDLERQLQASYPFFHLTMEDVWVWDKNRPTRMIPRAEVYTSSDVTIEELRGEGELPGADARGARREARRAADARRRMTREGAGEAGLAPAEKHRHRADDAAGGRRRQHADRLRRVRRRPSSRERWRVATEAERTADEIGALVDRLLELRDLDFERDRRRLPLLDRARARARVRELRRAVRRGADPRRRARA